MFRHFRAWALCAFVILLSACSSATQLAYNNADWLMMYEIDDYFDTDKTQEKFLDVSIEQFFCWHRQEALPEYVAMIEEVVKRSESELTRADLGWLFEQIEIHRRNALEQALPDMAKFLATVSEAQLKRMNETVAENSEETREILAKSREERLEERADKMMKRLREWFGRFDKKQTKQIRTLSKASPETREMWYQFQQERQEAMNELMRSTSDAKVIEAQLAEWWFTSANAYPVSFQNRDHPTWRKIEDMVLAIDKLLTPKQRQHFIDRINDYKEDFQALSQNHECTALIKTTTNEGITTPPGS